MDHDHKYGFGTKDLAQLIIQRLDGSMVDDTAYVDWLRWCVRQGCGGFIIFGGQSGPLKDLIADLQDAADIPLLIASDIECGLARQIEQTTRFPCQMAIASALYPHEEGLLKEVLNAIANECLYLGINMPLIPVLDVNINPDNPIIATRAFSDAPHVVSWFARRYVEVFGAKGLLIAGKHFPGHGDTSIDSHIDMPVINKTVGELQLSELVPFKTAIDSGIGCIMVGHLNLPCLDADYPASLSSNIINSLLRDEMGFDGLVITDAMNMGALKRYGNIYSRCLTAGADVILHPEGFGDCLQSLIDDVERGILLAETVQRAMRNIKRAKSKMPVPISQLDIKGHSSIAERLFEKVPTLIKSKDGLLPLSERCRLYVAGDLRYDLSPLKVRFGETLHLDAFSGGHDVIIIALFTTVSAWHGSSGLSPDVRMAVTEIIERTQHSIVISFGSPYVLRHFCAASVLIAAYEPSQEAQSAVVRCLDGERAFNHNLPVHLKPHGV